jgi:O-antigen/teichoic acid export membrane protein
MTDFGLAGNALVNVLSEAYGKDDRESAKQYTASAFWALTGIATILGLVFLTTFNWISWRAVFRVSAAVSDTELKTACGLTLALFFFNVPFSLMASVYNAYQDGYFANIWSIVSNVAALIGLIVVTHFHGGLPMLVLSLSGTRACVNLANAYHLFGRQYRWLMPVPSAVGWIRIKRLLTLGGKYMVTQVAALGIFQSQPMIITQMLGPAPVVIYVVTYKVITLPLDLAYMGTVPFISAFGEAKARGDWQWIKQAYRNATLVSLGLGIPLMVLIALASKPLIRIWAGPAAIPDGWVILWLCVYTLIGMGFMAAGQMLCGLERVEPLALSIVLCATGCVGLGIAFAPVWGVAGVVLAMAVSKFATFWPIQGREVKRIFRQSRAVEVNEVECVA